MNTKIQKWGNSFAVRIPKNVVEKHFLSEGSVVSVKENKESIIITPVKKKKNTLKLDDVLKKISSDNLHGELSWGENKGNEVW